MNYMHINNHNLNQYRKLKNTLRETTSNTKPSNTRIIRRNGIQSHGKRMRDQASCTRILRRS